VPVVVSFKNAIVFVTRQWHTFKCDILSPASNEEVHGLKRTATHGDVRAVAGAADLYLSGDMGWRSRDQSRNSFLR
jgi:hypothetical protein